MVTSQTSVFSATITTLPQVIQYQNVFLDNTHLRVVRRVTEETGEIVDTVMTLNSDYTVAGAGVEAGGTVTMVAGGAHDVQVGDVIVVSRNVPITQLSNYIPNQGISESTLERDLDKLCMICQQLVALVNAQQAVIQGFYEVEIDYCDGPPDDPESETVTKVFLVRDV